MRKAKHLDATTMFTYSRTNTPLGQSERAYYLNYFIKMNSDTSNVWRNLYLNAKVCRIVMVKSGGEYIYVFMIISLHENKSCFSVSDTGSLEENIRFRPKGFEPRTTWLLLLLAYRKTCWSHKGH